MKTLFKSVVLVWLCLPQVYAQTQRLSASASESVNDAPAFQARYNSTQSASKTMACGDFSFSAATYDAAQYSDDLIGADLNNDGKTDLIATVANSSISQLKINLNNGDGTFAAAINQATTQNIPWRVVAGDLNADGNTDLVAGHYQSANLSILLGNGNGTFQTPVNMATTGSTNVPVLADMNGDGKLDLVVTSGANTVVIYLGNGDGTFQSASPSVATGAGSTGLAVADFNGDGKMDVVKLNFEGSYASIILGNGDGTLQAATFTGTGSYAFDVITADFNADGKQDMVYSSVSNNRLEVRLGNGDGTFAAAVNYTTGSFPRHIGMGDMDGDGFVDIAVANQSSAFISIFEGNGDGTFQAKCDQTTTGGHWTMYVGNLDGRDNSDFAFSTSFGNKLYVYKDPGPDAVTTAATSITGTSATANGTITPNGKTILSAVFRYGTDPTLAMYSTQTVNVASVGTGSSAVPVTANLVGLSPNTTYYFRLVATYSNGAITSALGKTEETALNIETRGGLKTTSSTVPTVMGSILSFTTLGPVVTTAAATSVAATSATANGTINPNGLTITSASFRYGTDPALVTYSTRTVDVSSIGTGSSPVPVSANLAGSNILLGLSPNTTYYFQLVATYSDGAITSALGKTEETALNIKTRSGLKTTSGTAPTVMGSILSFTTLGPVVTTAAATSVAATSATANGTINPNGLTITSASFRYGTDPALVTYSTQTVNVASVGTGSSAVPVSANLTGLTGNTMYYFQLVATYSDVLLGKTETISPIVKGAILSFTTPAQYRPPVFTMPEVAAGEDGKPFNLELKAEDADGDPISYRIISGPDWISLTEEGGLFRLTGRAGQQDVGGHVVKVEATSGAGAGLLKTEFTITITISNVDYPPVFSSLDTAAGEDCKPLSHTIRASDLDGDVISYRIVSGPSWLTLKEEANGVVSLQGAPGQGEVGVHTVKISATSGSGSGLRTVEQTITITIADLAHPPVFSNPGLWGVVTQTGSAYSQSFTVNDCDGGSLRLYSDDLPSWITFGTAIPGVNSLTQSISGTTHTVGHYLFSLIASDGVSNAVLPLSVYVKPYYIPVVSSVPAPTFANQTVSYPIEVVAEDGDPFMVSVASAPAGLSLVCNGSASASGLCKGSERAELKGTINTASLPAWVKIRVSDDVTFNAQSSCQEFELVMDGSTLTTRNAQKTKCDGTPLVPTIQNRKATSSQEEVPSSFALESVYPNPFNPSTQISFSVPVTSPVRLEVFDLNGRVVATPFNQTVSAGSYTVSFQAHGLASGMYFVRMMAQDKVFSKQMVLMK